MESNQSSRPTGETRTRAQRRRSTSDMRMHHPPPARPLNRRSIDTEMLARDSRNAFGPSRGLSTTPGSGPNRAAHHPHRAWRDMPAELHEPRPHRYRYPAHSLSTAAPEPQIPPLLPLPPIPERREPQRPARRPPPSGRIGRILVFLGYGNGNRYRKELMSMLTTLTFAFIQFTVTMALVIYSGLHKSPVDTSISEWKACDKPLGAWAVIWIIKLVYDSSMTYWGWVREWKGRQGETRSRTEDVERTANARQERLDQRTEMSIWRELEELGGSMPPMPLDEDTNTERNNERRELPHAKLYSRLSFFLSLIVITWFITSNIFIYTSLRTCRHTSPHLWWLVFGILCIQYLIIAQVFLIAILVFIVGPIIYLLWNIVLMCMGRHPLQNPHYINPEIGKLSKHVVDQIPLVMYIPNPPGDEKGADKDAITKPTPIYSSGSSEHTYPPKRPQPRRMFTFINRRSSKSSTDSEGKPANNESKDAEKGAGESWEDCWEKNEFPFVRLEENRASCAICLLDFEEPKRRVASEVIKSWSRPKQKEKQVADTPKDSEPEAQPPEPSVNATNEKGDEDPASSSSKAEGSKDSEGTPVPPVVAEGDVQEVSVTQMQTDTSGRRNSQSLRLEDAGEGAQPLRLLECGHVFHKTCIDPWLLDVSGRCPTCQRPVTATQPNARKTSR